MTELALIVSICAVAGVALLAWLKSPWRSVYGWIAFLSVQLNYQIVFSDFRPALSDLFVPSMAIGALFYLARRGDSRRGGASVLSTLVLGFVAVFLTVGNLVTFVALGTLPQWTWLNKDIGLIDLIVCYFALLRLLDTREKLHAAVRVFVLSGSLINLVAIVGGIARYAFGIPNMMMRQSSSTRLVGFMINPGAYGGFALCILLIQFSLLLGGSELLRLPRWAQHLNVALLGMACLMTQSRSTLVGLVTGLLGLLVFFRVKASVRLLGLGLAVLVGMIAVLSVYAFSSKTVSDFWSTELNSANFALRIDANRAAMNMYLESPANALLGIGIGTFSSRAQQYIGLPLIIHNDFLWLLVEAGPLGLCLFCAILFVTFRNCIVLARAGMDERPIAIGVACALLATLGWMLGTEGLWHRHVWFLLTLSEVCYRLQMRKSYSFVPYETNNLKSTHPFVFDSCQHQGH